MDFWNMSMKFWRMQWDSGGRSGFLAFFNEALEVVDEVLADVAGFWRMQGAFGVGKWGSGGGG